MKQNGKWLLLLLQVIPAHISSYHNRKDVISWGLNKMADILQTTFWSAFCWMESLILLLEISLKSDPDGHIYK